METARQEKPLLSCFGEEESQIQLCALTVLLLGQSSIDGDSIGWQSQPDTKP
tara:strand:- start:128 stop:283 length:156 start_codon:yes stop_codon:yes gene_type:complete